MATKKKQAAPDAPTEEIEPVQESALTPDTPDHSLTEGDLTALDPNLADTPENQVAVGGALPSESPASAEIEALLEQKLAEIDAQQPKIIDSGEKITVVDEVAEANRAIETGRLASYWAREGRPTRFSYGGRDYVVETYLEGPKFNEVGRTKPSALLAEKTSFGRRGGN